MSKDDLELLRGSGNVYRDLGRPTADLEQARALVAAKIIRLLDERKLSTRDAEKLTGISHSEFSRIRGTQLRRFTLDRLIAILGKLDADLEVNVAVQPRRLQSAAGLSMLSLGGTLPTRGSSRFSKGHEIMSKDRLFVERRPQGDYAVRKGGSERASAVEPTQAQAIERARELNPGKSPLVERVRDTSVGHRDKWRKI
jgi:predicted XRE-type DNA-binding protein